MRLVTLRRETGSEAALVHDEHAVPVRHLLETASVPAPVPPSGLVRMMDLLLAWGTLGPVLASAAGSASELVDAGQAVPLDQARLGPPVPRPRSLRDFYAFEEHVERSFKRRGEPIPEAWYEAPVFYFSNPATIVGPEDPVRRPSSSQALDFELEVGWVIGRQASDLSVDQAEEAIVGLTILDDFSARDVQAREMGVGLGPSKGKDFATAQGPALVTLDELEDARSGRAFDLEMTAKVNGKEVSRGNLASIHYSLAEMTAHASRDARIVPGDVMGTGTVGTGSILDLGTEDWLSPGDTVTLEVERLGVLENEIVG